MTFMTSLHERLNNSIGLYTNQIRFTSRSLQNYSIEIRVLTEFVLHSAEDEHSGDSTRMQKEFPFESVSEKEENSETKKCPDTFPR